MYQKAVNGKINIDIPFTCTVLFKLVTVYGVVTVQGKSYSYYNQSIDLVIDICSFQVSALNA